LADEKGLCGIWRLEVGPDFEPAVTNLRKLILIHDIATHIAVGDPKLIRRTALRNPAILAGEAMQDLVLPLPTATLGLF